MTDERIDHPPHYTAHPSGIEAIQLCELLPFAAGNALKYLWRAGLKPGSSRREDLQKALWYARRTAGHACFRTAKDQDAFHRLCSLVLLTPGNCEVLEPSVTVLQTWANYHLTADEAWAQVEQLIVQELDRQDVR